MMRRIVYIIQVLTVNFLILTPIMVGHHHHNGIPHFFAMEEAHETHESNDDCDCCSHKAETDFCQFDQPVDLIKVAHEEFTIPLQAIVTLFIFDPVPPETEKLSPNPYLFLYFNDWTVRSYGLRAPPVA